MCHNNIIGFDRRLEKTKEDEVGSLCSMQGVVKIAYKILVGNP
jgi:hypothetical protein